MRQYRRQGMSKLKERRREITVMDQTQAQKELADLQRKLFDLRLQKQRGEVKNNRLFAQTRVDIARLKFHLGELLHADLMAAELEIAGAEEAAATEEEATQAKSSAQATPAESAEDDAESAEAEAADEADEDESDEADEDESDGEDEES